MIQDWSRLHNVFLSNITGGIYEWLATRLGVSTDSLKAMQVGYTPRVVFGGKGLKAEKVSYDGWFTVPMRSADAKIVGFSLRGLNDKKVMYPGSKPGCMFAVNPAHRHGEHGYSSGSHNWVRTMDGGICCPICNKPDGCLVSTENPADPKAVVCIRTESPVRLKFGWLHIRKDTGILASASPLPGGDTGTHVVIVEGMSDACAAYDLGLVGLGRPNAQGGLEIVADLVRGRACIIVGENDKKANGDWPGQVGASMTLKACAKSTAKARILYPPSHVKDLRVWLTNYGLTKDTLLADAAEKGEEHITTDLIADDRPLTIFRAFLRDVYTLGKVTVLKNWESSWYVYSETDARYVPTQEANLMGAFMRWSDPKMVTVETAKGEKAERLKATASLWSSLRMAAMADGYLDGAIPKWINGKQGVDPRDLICFNNGILDVNALLDGETDYLVPTTPDLFTTHALPFSFDPAAECPLWLSFLGSSLGDDPAKISLLQEWMGYCMTPDTSMEKMLYMRGPTGSGKGTVLSVVQQLVGDEQAATPQFDGLSEGFGLQSLVGKLVCLIGDARDVGGALQMKSLQVLLSIVGRDALQINRKFKEHLEGNRLTCRITIAANTFLNIPDSTGALQRRLSLLEFSKTITKPDITLKDRLKGETAGIALWALTGLRRLRTQGYFTTPVSSAAAMEEWKLYNNPLASFLEECIDVTEKGLMPRRMLWDAWVKWAEQHKQRVATKTQFFNDMMTLATYATTDSVPVSGGNEIIYRGITLTREAARRYCGKP